MDEEEQIFCGLRTSEGRRPLFLRRTSGPTVGRVVGPTVCRDRWSLAPSRGRLTHDNHKSAVDNRDGTS